MFDCGDFFWNSRAIQFPIKGFTLDWYAKALQSETFMDSFKLSLLIGVLATVLALIVGIPASYAGTLFRSWAQLY